MLFAPIDLTASTDEKPIHVLDAGCGTGESQPYDLSLMNAAASTVLTIFVAALFDTYDTGVWSMEQLKECPQSTTFTLIDTKTQPCQTSYPELPSNAELLSFNMLQDFPTYPKWENHFDLINQRYLLAAFTPKEWQQVLTNHFNILKPGGYIQIIETKYHEIQCGPWMKRAAKWGLGTAQKYGIDLCITPQLPEILQKSGFTIVEQMEKDANFDITPKQKQEEPIPNAVALFYIDFAKVMAQRAREEGVISESDYDEFASGIQDEATDLPKKKDYIFREIVIVAQVEEQQPSPDR